MNSYRSTRRIATLVGRVIVGGVIVGGLAVAAAGCAGDEGAGAAPTASTNTASTNTASTSTASSTAESSTVVDSTSASDPADENERAPLRTITVSGDGEVTVRPDVAHVGMGVLVTGAAAQDVLDQANERAAALVAALKALGVADDDIQTSGISINPQYDPDSRTVVGFQASNGLSVTIRDLERAGEIIDGGAAFAGDAITIDGIWFSVADPEAVLSAARGEAIENATKRANEFAGAAGAAVGAVISISEVALDQPQSIYNEFAADRAVSSVPLQAGTQDLIVNVTVVFELVPS